MHTRSFSGALPHPATDKDLKEAEKDRDDAPGRYERTMTSNAMNNRWPVTGLGLGLGCLLFVAAPCCEAQNLVPNAGFEESDTCVHLLGLGGLQNWYSAYLTPDHLQGCLSYGAANGLPLNTFTYQESFEGQSCIGIHTYHTDGSTEQREWIMVPLLEPMIVGQTYYCSFRANAAFGGNAQYPTIWLGSNNIGMLFTTYDRHWYWGDAYPAPLNTAHMMRTDVLADTVSWTLVSGNFVADSAYTYLMIGNFFSNALTDTLHFAGPNSVFPWYPRGYTLIDAVCVSPSPMGCDLGQGVSENSDTGAVLFPNPVRGELFIAGRRGVKASIMDALGRSVWQGRIPSDRWAISVSSWALGSYVLRMELNTWVESRKFVVVE